MSPTHLFSVVRSAGLVGRRADLILLSGSFPRPSVVSFPLACSSTKQTDPLQSLHSLHTSCACPRSALHVYALCVRTFQISDSVHLPGSEWSCVQIEKC